MDRGVIEHRQRAQQITDYSGLRIGNITPTDIDGLIEYRSQLFIFIEMKVKNVEMPRGQAKAFTELCDCLSRPAVVFLAEHETPLNQDINAAISIVNKYYYNGRWRQPSRPMTLREAIIEFINFIEEKEYKL